MMKKQQSLHELNKYFPHDIHLKTLVILIFNVTIDVDTQHLGHYALESYKYLLDALEIRNPLLFKQYFCYGKDDL